jgi:(p)ppGpp synthase/HD superfamily hydrolase
MKREESVALGESLLAQAVQQMNFSLGDVAPARWDALVRDGQARDRDEILADVGLGRRLAVVVARQLALGGPPAEEGTDGQADRTRPAAPAAAPVVIRGTEGMALQMAKCCSPIPGDAIVGHMRKDQGLAVHQTDCVYAARARRADPDRWVDLQWADETAGSYAVSVDVSAANERGVLGRIAVALAEADSNILSVHLEDENAEQALIHFKLQVHDRRHLARLMRMLRRIKQVSRVTRVRAGRGQPSEDGDSRS